MGAIRQPMPVKLVIPMLAGEPAWFARAQEALCQEFGPVDYISDDLAFDYTGYYAPEMGAPLLRRFIAFEPLLDPGALAQAKTWTNALEQEWAREGRRAINLDPGYLTAAKFVLATTKDYAHRIYIGQGIYAEVTLLYRGGAFEALPWTYPDYRSAAYQRILGEIRSLYMAALRATRSPDALTPQSG
jgi:hypothetical protein